MTDEQPISRAANASERDVLVASLYQQGVPVTEIADRVGVCVKTVRNVARRFGLPPRNPSRPERDAQVISRYETGEKVALIARDLGIAKSRVRTIAARAGLPPRSDWRRRYPLDEGVFDNPSEVGWWLIGLLAANAAEFEPDLATAEASGFGGRSGLDSRARVVRRGNTKHRLKIERRTTWQRQI
jgi:transposase